jgi:hypothetical protein
MASALTSDLARLDRLAFRRREHCEPEIRQFHSLRSKAGKALLAGLHEWMFVPLSLWPVNFHDLYKHALGVLSRREKLGDEFLALLDILPPAPDPLFAEAVAECEHLVAAGRYEEFVQVTDKFASVQNDLERDPEFLAAWEEFRARWHPEGHANKHGIIRRSFSEERNLRNNFAIDWERPEHRFRAAFDAFCHRWGLYGMQDNTPLVNKLTVNFTPHGTMIFIPAYWSPDNKRDLHWEKITRVHRLRSLKKQGRILSENVRERRARAKKLRQLDAEALKLNLKGARRHAFLCKGLGFVEGTDAKRLERLRREYRDTQARPRVPR